MNALHLLDGVRAGYSRAHPVLVDCTLALSPGRTLLLGPNGAGKSTIMRTAAGLLRPSAGRVWHESAVGYMPQDIRPVPGMTVHEHLVYAGWLMGLSTREAAARADTTLAAVGLEDFRARRTNRLSGGERRRIGLAEALLRQGDVLLLDEPTAGLDIAEKIRFRELVRALTAPYVVVSTHEVAEIRSSFTHVVVVMHGKVVYSGPVDDFLAEGAGGQDAAESAYLRITGGVR